MRVKDQIGLPLHGFSYKGNLHSHTVNSDGCLTPEQSVELFRSHGYHFLCLSEHDKYTDYRSEFDCDDFIILPGLEASANLMVSETDRRRIRTHHMHGILGTRAMQQSAGRLLSHGEVLPPPLSFGAWDGAAVSQRLAETLRGYGCLVTYNHPIWSRVEPEEFVNLEGVWALEIYNYNTVNESGTGADTTYWDLMLRRGHRIFAFASDDNHNGGVFDDACGGWIQVVADHLDHETILSAMLRGDFYSSNGPEIYAWGIRDNRAYVECSACERVNVICGGFLNAGVTRIAPTRDGLRRAEFELTGDETYVRVECVDYQGKTAWTNALFLEKE
ncbi:MAG: PHP domain-containing protein [Clostridiales bacterium]|nr:PHP domain-containing protein [Clostridiales bacterium]